MRQHIRHMQGWACTMVLTTLWAFTLGHIGATPTFAITTGGFNYVVSGSNAIVTGCAAACPAALTIPAALDGLPVVGIGQGAFSAKGLTSVVIPDSIISVGSWSFDNNSLRTVQFGSAVQHIGAAAFYTNELVSVTIPNSVFSIGERAFAFNRSLASVTLGTAVASIGARAFWMTQLTRITIPDSVKVIGERAFYELALGSLSLGSGVERIEYQAFQSNRLTSLTIPASVVFIDAHAFSVNQLRSVAFLGSAPPDMAYVFDNNDELNWVYRPANALGWGATWGGKRVVIATRATATVKPTITGTAIIRRTITAKTGTWRGAPAPTYRYQWYACTKAVTAARSTVPSTCTAIVGATRSTFKLTVAQRNKYVAVLVTGTSAGTTATTWLSKTTAKVR